MLIGERADFKRYTVRHAETRAVIASFQKVGQAFQFVRSYDPSGVIPLDVFDNHFHSTVNWAMLEFKTTKCDIQRDFVWQKEGF